MSEENGGAGVLVLAAIALIYWLVPADVIPDALPMGLLDDIIVGALAGTGIMKSQI